MEAVREAWAAGRDPVDVFFELLPTPDEHNHKTGDELSQQLTIAGAAFNACLYFRGSSDPDHDLIKRALRNCREVGSVYMQLAGLAMDKPVDPDDSSHKAVYLRYLRWVASGRKDELPPSETPGHLEARCKACDKHGATMKCAGCLISTDGYTAFSTDYCGTDCQKNDWPKHKTACKQVQQLSRAMGMFGDILRHLPSITYYSRYRLQSITREQGMVIVKNAAEFSTKDPKGFISFSSDIAPSPDLADAVLMNSQCAIPWTDARPLVELLIRPICASLETIVFMPKNVAQPIRMIHTDRNEFNNLQLHHVVRATLPCGLQFALDPTGLQLGWKHSVVPWSTYCQRHIHQLHEHRSAVLNPVAIGHLTVTNCLKKKKKPELMRECMVEVVVHSLARQLCYTKLDLNVRKLLRLSKKDFAAASSTVAAVAKRGLSHIVKQYTQDHASPRCFWPSELLFKSTSSDREEQVRLACGLVLLYFGTKDESEDMMDRDRWIKVMVLGPLPGLEIET